MKKILARVYLRVCAPTTVDDYLGMYNFSQYILNHLLHAQSIQLPLPAMIIDAIVSDMEEKSFDAASNSITVVVKTSTKDVETAKSLAKLMGN